MTVINHGDIYQVVLSLVSIFLALTYPLISLFRRNRSSSNAILISTLLLTASLEAFDLLAFINHERLYFWKKFSLLAEACLPSTWLLFSLTFARRSDTNSIPFTQRIFLGASLLFIVAALTLPVKAFYYSPDFVQERMLFLGNAGFAFYLAFIVYVIIALINLEFTLANASLTSRWKIKFEILGAGSLLAVMIFYYSQGLLYRTINMNLVSVRALALTVAVLLIAYSQLKRGDGVTIFVSRNLVIKSVVLFVVGLYLIGLGLMGEGMKYFGESFHRSMVIAIAFLTGIGIIVCLLSETIKRKIRVFIYKNFYQNKYDYRIQWLQFINRLATSKTRDELLLGILSGYCETFGMGCGALFLYSSDHGEYQAVVNVEMDPTSISFSKNDPLIEYMAERKWVVNTREGGLIGVIEPETFFRINGLLFVIPLFLDAVMDGFIVLGKPLNANETYNFEDYDLMKTIACQASSAILNLRLSDQLAKAREMEAIGKVSAFVAHDLKNLVYTVSLIVDNSREYITDPEFQRDMLESLDNTVTKMKTLISKLKNVPEKSELHKEPADLLRLVTDTASLITGTTVHVSGSAVIAEIDRDELQKVTLNLLLNAVDATDGKGPVIVEVGKGDQAYIKVKDEGCGIQEEFLHHHLFTPFQTTKKKGLGIGLYQCKQIVEAHGGKIEVNSEAGKGAEFTVWLPFVRSSVFIGEN